MELLSNGMELSLDEMATNVGQNGNEHRIGWNYCRTKFEQKSNGHLTKFRQKSDGRFTDVNSDVNQTLTTPASDETSDGVVADDMIDMSLWRLVTRCYRLLWAVSDVALQLAMLNFVALQFAKEAEANFLFIYFTSCCTQLLNPKPKKERE